MGKGVARWGVGLLLTALVCGLARPLAGEEKASKSGQPGQPGSGTSLIDSLSFTSRREPIHIRSHDLEFLYNEKRIIYRGDVVATQGDVTVKSDLDDGGWGRPASVRERDLPTASQRDCG